MLRIIYNSSSFADSDLVMMVRRENNAKRNYLLVNSRQGKHIPTDPDEVLDLFRQLADEVKKHIQSEKIIFIGFAETATAVGAGVASHFENSFYIHTTRETKTEGVPVVEFREEHSHAAEQLLYCDRWSEIVSEAEHIVFVEDEISTGRTIMNFINALKSNGKVSETVIFSACSILNGMTTEREKKLKEDNVNFYYLLRHCAEPDSDEVYTFSPENRKRNSQYVITEKTVNGRINPRTGCYASDYISSCRKLAEQVALLTDIRDKDIAVIGTEECMFPAVCTAAEIMKSGAASVVTHSTTRSPIVADRAEEYPLKSRYQVESFYEKERRTFIYNSDIKRYDLVMIVTDSENSDYDFSSMADAFGMSDSFIVVRWVK